MTRSLLTCESYCGTLTLEFGKILQKTQSDESFPENRKTPIIEEYMPKLEAEEAYKFILQDYKENF